MESKIKPYKITITNQYEGFDPYDAIGHFIKGDYFVIEESDGDRTMLNKDNIHKILIDKKWQDD